MAKIGLDVGGTKIVGLLAEADGRVLDVVRRKTPPKGDAEGVIAEILSLARELKGRGEQVSSLCVGIAAFVDQSRKYLHYAPNLGLEHLALGEMLEQQLGLPVWLDNDVNCAVLGEASFGAATGCRNVVGILVGTGIGSGILLDGRVVRGARGVGAEAGHMVFVPSGRQCACGRRGCFEAYAGGRSLEAIIQQARQEEPQSLLNQDPAANLSAVWRAKEAGDRRARRLWEDFLLALRVLTGNLVTIFDPEMVLLGGKVVSELPAVLAAIKDDLIVNRLRGVLHTVQVCAPSLGDTAVALGATCLAETH